MLSFVLKPTYENLVDTYIKDAIGRNKDVVAFSEILNTIDKSCSIAIDCDWGNGKTFFVRQVKLLLDSHNDHINNINDEDKAVFKREEWSYLPHVNVYYDAWANDNDDDPVLSLVYTILKDVNDGFSLREAPDCLKAAAAILNCFTDKNWSEIIEVLQGEDPLNGISNDKKIEDIVKEFLDNLLDERGERLNIFIDELDRCNPKFAVKLLERIKHYFDNDRITFIFSINSKELQHTIKNHYGEGFDASKYLERFFDIRMSLPKENLNKFYTSIDFNKETTMEYIAEVFMEKYDFSMRARSKYISLLKISTNKLKEHSFSFPEGKALEFALVYILPVALGLRLYDIDQYSDFINGKDYVTLNEIIGGFDKYYFTDLLNHGETFDESDTELENFTLEEKIDAVYKALFDTTYTSDNYRTRIGDFSFTNATKQDFMNTVGLLSRYSGFEE